MSKDFQSPLRDFLLLDLLFTYCLHHKQLVNNFLAFHLISELINCYNFVIFFDDCFGVFKNYVFSNIKNLPLS